MPGAIPHLMAAFLIFFIARYYFKDMVYDINGSWNQLFLLSTCILFTVSPDIIMIFYHVTKIFSHCFFEPFHIMLHGIIGISAVVAFPFVYINRATSVYPFMITGLMCIYVHMGMDLLIEETTIFI